LNASRNTDSSAPARVAGPSWSAIRPLHPSDVDPLHHLLLETGVFTADEIAIALELIHTVLDKPEQRDYIIRVYDDGCVLGYYCIGPTPATTSTFDLYWIATKPSVHGKGIGQLLNAHAEETIRAAGGTLVIAETSSTPRYDKTRMFYHKAGYDELARIRDYYGPGDSLVVFGKYLSQ
jgi:ribosomal protein S18 acetylase RimI-like enzyme